MNSYKREIDPQTHKTNLCLPKQKGRRDKSGVCDYHIHITMQKIDNQQGSTVQQKKKNKKNIEPLFCILETIIQLIQHCK